MAVKLKPADIQRFARRFAVEPGTKVKLKKDFDPGNTEGYKKPENATEILEAGVELLATYQDKLYGEGSRGLLIVLQALDAAGKDGTIKHVMSGVNPQGCQVTSFKSPSSVDLSHDYLWRCIQALPQRGHIGIFNRSYYEEVLVVRVHPTFLDAQRLPSHTLGDKLWAQRFGEINNFEQYLTNNGFEVVKVFLNVSKHEQCGRLLERIDTPDKNWKFSAADLKERMHWDEYMAAYDDMLTNTSTAWAPWYVVPADNKWFSRIAVAAIIASKMIDMDPNYPAVSEESHQQMLGSRQSLVDECGGSQPADKPKKKDKAKDGAKKKK